jgi:RNA polymerase sigma factor (sigma-70 family)
MELNREQQAMVEANIPLVGYVINKYLRSANVDHDDMASVGYIALCMAVKKFDPNSGRKFSTYAAMSIVNNIRKEMKFARRRKRGLGFVTLSFDQLMEDADNRNVKESMLGYEPDFANRVIDKILCEPLWVMCPTQRKLLMSDTNTRELGRMEGITSKAIYARGKKEFEEARKYLRRIGIYNADAV